MKKTPDIIMFCKLHISGYVCRVKDGEKLVIIMLLIINLLSIRCLSWAMHWVKGSMFNSCNNSVIIPFYR